MKKPPKTTTFYFFLLFALTVGFLWLYSHFLPLGIHVREFSRDKSHGQTKRGKCVAGELTNYSHYKRTSLQSANVINMGLSATNLKSNINSLGNNMAGFCSKYLLQLGRLEMPSKPSARF